MGFLLFRQSGQQNLYTYYVEFAIKAAATGTRLGIILDNKWYHNSYGQKLRAFLIKHCTIEALIEYPFGGLFSDWTIATSMLICQERDSAPTDARASSSSDRLSNWRESIPPRQDGLSTVPVIGRLSGRVDPFFKRNSIIRNGWKSYFSAGLSRDFRLGLSALTGPLRV